MTASFLPPARSVVVELLHGPSDGLLHTLPIHVGVGGNRPPGRVPATGGHYERSDQVVVGADGRKRAAYRWVPDPGGRRGPTYCRGECLSLGCPRWTAPGAYDDDGAPS